MKKSLTILLVFLFANSTLYAQYTEWNGGDSGTDNALLDVSLVDANNGWACGYQNILYSSDGGENWEIQYSSANASFSSIDFVDELNGWVVGYDIIEGQLILHTSDGGETWEEQTAPDPIYSFIDIQFVNSQKGWAVGGRSTGYPGFDSFLQIITTNDGGQTWTIQLDIDNAPVLGNVFFVNENVGYVKGGGMILRTTNGGNSWYDVSPGLTSTLYSLFFIDEDMGWVLGYYNGLPHVPMVMKTINGGASWTVVYLDDYPSNVLKGVAFIDENVGWMVGGTPGSLTLKTEDGGATWSPEASGTIWSLKAIDIANGRACAVGKKGATVFADVPIVTGIEKTDLSRQFAVYPNPATDYIRIEKSSQNELEIDEIAIYSLAGKQVYLNRNGNNTQRINIENLESGIYILKIMTDKGAKLQKLIVE